MMRQTIRVALLVCLLLGAMAARAQHRELNPVRIASLMLTEKKAGAVDYKPFAAYLDSLGFTAKGANRYQKEWTDRDGKKLPVSVTLEQGGTRRVSIDVADNGTIWWMVLQLKDFGLRESGHDGSAVFLKGKGLKATALPNRLWLSYETKGGK